MKKSRKFNSILAAATLCAISAGSTVAIAQEISTDKPQIQQSADTTKAPNQTQVASKCSQLIGTCVRNQQGEKLGRITDVVVSFDNERVSYCVLSVKPGIFAKTKYMAVPLAAFQPSEDGSHLILNANRANLAKAEGFARNQWPSAIVPAWGAEPAAPQELPPVEVFAPAVEPTTPTVAYPTVFDPAMDPPPVYQSVSRGIGALQFDSAFGYLLTGH